MAERSLVVKVTAGKDDPERCNQAFTVAAAAVASGVRVSLWLTGESAWFGLPGRAEEIPLPDASVDAVLAGQALHWFDLSRAIPEIARVLTPGGVLAALWNVDDDRIGWVATLAQISKGKSNVTLRRWRDGVARTRLERLTAAGSGLFGTLEAGEFGHGQRRTADSLVAAIATHSNLLVMTEPDRTRLLAQVRDFLGACPETAAGEFVLPMVTVVLRATRK